MNRKQNNLKVSDRKFNWNLNGNDRTLNLLKVCLEKCCFLVKNDSYQPNLMGNTTVSQSWQFYMNLCNGKHTKTWFLRKNKNITANGVLAYLTKMHKWDHMKMNELATNLTKRKLVMNCHMIELVICISLNSNLLKFEIRDWIGILKSIVCLTLISCRLLFANYDGFSSWYLI